MPRHSEKQLLLKRLDDVSVVAVKHAARSQLFGHSTARVDELLFRCRDLHSRVKSKRCLSRRLCGKRTPKLQLFLDANSDDCLAETEFKFHFRMERECFKELVSLFKDHPSFQKRNSDARGPPPKPAEQQLLVLLKCCGCQGNSACNVSLSNFFGVSKGVVDGRRINSLEALPSLEDRTHVWPDVEERKAMAARIKDDYYFPHCVGLIDGTLLPLAYRPIIHGENYVSRKRFYAMVMLVVCDDNGRVLCCHIGWPEE